MQHAIQILRMVGDLAKQLLELTGQGLKAEVEKKVNEGMAKIQDSTRRAWMIDLDKSSTLACRSC
jgi:hypothetical protein